MDERCEVRWGHNAITSRAAAEDGLENSKLNYLQSTTKILGFQLSNLNLNHRKVICSLLVSMSFQLRSLHSSIFMATTWHSFLIHYKFFFSLSFFFFRSFLQHLHSKRQARSLYTTHSIIHPMTFSLHDYDENFIICLWLLQFSYCTIVKLKHA